MALHEGEEEERRKEEVTYSLQKEFMKGTHNVTVMSIRQHVSSLKLRCRFLYYHSNMVTTLGLLEAQIEFIDFFLRAES
jgi:hypothetical protein